MNAARPGEGDLDPDDPGEVEPVRMPGLNEVDFQSVHERLGQETTCGLAQPAKDRGRLARRVLGLRQAGEEVGASRRRSGREAPPEHADRADQRHRRRG